MQVKEDKHGWLHIDWELDGVTPKMLDWWWCNMEKGFALWHPKDHKDFYWVKRPVDGRAIGAIHVAPQMWSDGTLIKPHIRWDDVETLPEEILSLIVYDHLVVAAGISLTGEEVREDDPPISYRIHQWEKTDYGVKGISSAISMKPEPPEVKQAWVKHCIEEIGYFEQFLPQLYFLWRKVDDPYLNPYFCFRIEKEGDKIRYVNKKTCKTGRVSW